MIQIFSDIFKTLFYMWLGGCIAFIGETTQILLVIFFGVMMLAFSPAFFLSKYGEMKDSNKINIIKKDYLKN